MPRPQLTLDEIDSFRFDACVVALQIIAESDLEGLTFRELGRRLGCSYAKPHRYFGDKDRLLDAIRAHAFDQFARFVSGVDPASEGVPLEERYLRFATSHSAAFEVMFGFRQAYVSDETRAAEDRAWQVCTKPFYEAVERGEMAGDPEKLAHVAWVSMHGLSALALSGQLTHGLDEQEIRFELGRLLRAMA